MGFSRQGGAFFILDKNILIFAKVFSIVKKGIVADSQARCLKGNNKWLKW